MADGENAALGAFREEARAWLEVNHPASLRAQSAAEADAEMFGGATLDPDSALWKSRIGAKGWGVPTWPKQYGGGGLTLAQARVLNEEMARIGARNAIGGMGVAMFGPTLLEFGSEAQKKRHIPKIATGEVRWCQGFSEPGAGSDLASLQLKCEDKGDHYLVNGSKIWTSGANFADWCFCLVRTDVTRKHEGISFLLIDMKTPGVDPQPIMTIAGASPFCQTFFTDVKVPKENLMGELNKGWSYAKRLLQFERQGSAGRGDGAPAPGGAQKPISQIAISYLGADQAGRLADPDIRARVALHQMEQRAFRLTAQRVAAEARGSNSPTTTTSILKNVGAKTGQDRAELLIEIMGNRGLGWEGEGFSDDERASVRLWLSGKATSIFAGSHEVQNNIISKRILGLPDMNAGA